MIRKLFILSFFIIFSRSIFAYDYEFKSDDVSISLKFEDRKIKKLQIKAKPIEPRNKTKPLNM